MHHMNVIKQKSLVIPEAEYLVLGLLSNAPLFLSSL